MSISGLGGVNSALLINNAKATGVAALEIFADPEIKNSGSTANISANNVDKIAGTSSSTPSLSSQTTYDAQRIGQKQPEDNNNFRTDAISAASDTPIGESGKKPISKVYEEFQKWVEMTPAERIRAQILEEEGITEEEFAKLPAEAQEKILQKIRERVELATKQKTDVLV